MNLMFEINVRSKSGQNISQKSFETFVDGVIFNLHGKTYKLLESDECVAECFTQHEVYLFMKDYFKDEKMLKSLEISDSDTVTFCYTCDSVDFRDTRKNEDFPDAIDIKLTDIFTEEEIETGEIDDDEFNIYELKASICPLFKNNNDEYVVTISNFTLEDDVISLSSNKTHHVTLI